MVETCEPENASIPVTALAYVELGRLFLIAGEGSYVKIYDHQTGILISRHRVFESECVHGIVCCIRQYENQIARADLLMWGGRSLCLVQVEEHEIAEALRFEIAFPEVRHDDRILDVCFNPFAESTEDYTSARFKAVAVTARSQLRRLKFHEKKVWEIEDSPHSEDSASGCSRATPNALLYSAHIGWSKEDHANGHIFVATGTVLGEVLFWSTKYDGTGKLGALQLHYRFTGHLGSIFGVRIGSILNPQACCAIRVLASCSDDRTIRIWDVSDWRISSPAVETKQCLATVTGHASRIWAVRFLYSLSKIPQLLSLGEDGTVQAWLLQPASEKLGDHLSQSALILVHDAEYHYHCGKHIWASAILGKGDGSSLISTGGADGRIVSYWRNAALPGTSKKVIACQSTISEAKSPKGELSSAEATTPKRTIFQALQGQWKLSRVLSSALPTYPSGKLEGIANFERRPPTGLDVDEECSYIEEGEFTADIGMIMRAACQYVYRYHQQTDELTIWFVKPEDRGAVDYLFHRLDLRKEEENRHIGEDLTGKMTWTAAGHHLCLNDDYVAEYTFTFMNQHLETWRLRYIVKGPQKSYVADATYSRSSSASGRTQSGTSLDYTAAASKPNEPSKVDAFKKYAWVGNSEFLTTTDYGNVLLGRPDTECSANNGEASPLALKWHHVGESTDLVSSSLMTSIPSLGIAFLSGNNGRVFRYQSQSKTLEFFVTRQQKPAFMKAQRVHMRKSEDGNDRYGNWGTAFDFAPTMENRNWISLVMTSLTSNRVDVSLHTSDEIEAVRSDRKRSIELPKNFVVTSSCLLDRGTLVILGSRKGDLIICDVMSSHTDVAGGQSKSVHADIHGQDAITDILPVPEEHPQANPDTSWILTTGRDGRFAIHRITLPDARVTSYKARLETFHESNLPFGPRIEGAHFDTTSQELLLWGFHSTHFVVWNETTKTQVMSINCGGAQRHWAFSPLDDGLGGGNFVWTKVSTCNMYKQTEASHRVLEPGGHGREIKTIAVSSALESLEGPDQPMIATGAEDTAIRLFEYDAHLGYKCLRVITKHTTGIQKLQWFGEHGQYLFSAAGCEEFFVWRISKVPILGIGSICSIVGPAVTSDKDLRIMDFSILDILDPASAAVEGVSTHLLIAMVYSDSSVRIFEFRGKGSRIVSLTLLSEGRYTSHCLTQTMFLNLSSELFLCTAGTDGHLAFWGLRAVLELCESHHPEHSSTMLNGGFQSRNSPGEISWQTSFQIHQNSIKGLSHISITSEEALVVTCGDDQSLAFIHIAMRAAISDNTRLIPAVLLVPGAHASAITAVTYLSSEDEGSGKVYSFASVGNDQRLRVWQVIDNISEETVERFTIQKQRDEHTSIADAASLSTMSIRGTDSIRLCIAGIGMETWSVVGSVLPLPNRRL